MQPLWRITFEGTNFVYVHFPHKTHLFQERTFLLYTSEEYIYIKCVDSQSNKTIFLAIWVLSITEIIRYLLTGNQRKNVKVVDYITAHITAE